MTLRADDAMVLYNVACVFAQLGMKKDAPEVDLAEAWVCYVEGKYDETVTRVRSVISRKQDTEGAYYLLGRALFASGRYQELIDISEEAMAHTVEDYNVLVPIRNALGALGKTDAFHNQNLREVQLYESHLKKVPEDARARTLLAGNYASLNRADDAAREANLAMTLRADDAMVLYNVACVFAQLGMKKDALGALKKAWEAGARDADWARNDPDLEGLRGDPEFERLYPAK